ncbi:TIGR00282 family metallophosphoesterase [Sulfobacillus thermosulfidooxidans]|uniref:TIGR00282 family metallophosphoesterase n=1 Tax=Sulfobacillus thermosulfidooxidans TaxID=28034 RepID=UPI00096B76E4|nr:TIGR00282 family metallophosphoesterase [Sulfobacillus thermosulfidooxidans]OLZ09554.1 metallophosphoesterase [Sulfobacillus thermosulfidooxidans]OLZ16140.1 metallophosphoesterase [Sulfobacillus thermosulfidooxidans]OLZ18012.1 metallophosphoesterase [Sulfobacillus thermosulfidooxidans]
MKVLLVGDVVGKVGRRMLKSAIPIIKAENGVTLVVANGENAAGGNGLTHEIMDDLLASGVDVLSSGNHIFDKKEVLEFLDDVPALLRPLNLPVGTPGHGYVVTGIRGIPVAVINLAGRAFMPFQYDDPFAAIDRVLDSLAPEVRVILVDFHAETTSEKAALAWYLDGKVSVVVGTHTHVQTADERILPQGTAFITDLGMTGPRDSVIGVKTELVIQKLKTQMPVRFDTATGPGQFGGLIVDIDEQSGRAREVKRIFYRE